MPKMTDQEFDNLFRQAANRMSPEHQQGDWEDMQRKLEAAERDARARNISLYSMVALLLLYSFLMPDGLKFGRVDRASFLPGVEQSESHQLPAETKQPEIASEKKTIHNEKGETTARDAATGVIVDAQKSVSSAPDGLEVQESTQHKTTKDVEQADGSPGPSKEAAADINKEENDKTYNNTSDNNRRNNNERDNNRTDNNTTDNNRTDNNNIKRSGSMQVAGVTAVGVRANGNTATSSQAAHGEISYEASSEGHASHATRIIDAHVLAASNEPASKNTVAQGNLLSAGAVFTSDAPETPSTVPLGARTQQRPANVLLVSPGKVMVPEQPRHPWFVKVAVSPDFSSIDYGSAGKTGVNFGPLVEYGLSPRLSLSTGAIWSKKLYDQQNPEKSYGSGGYVVHANKLDGDCRILDIPMNVTYYLMPGRKTNLFVTAGVSSYIMLKEEYIYTVSKNNYNYEYTENYSHKNNEWFSMLNLSVGIQHQVANRWFVQGEPFIKAPMKGVGEGKVNLVSAGIFVSVKYRINP